MKFEGVAYRAHNPQWAWDPLSGEGAALHGGRFNRIGLPTLISQQPSKRLLTVNQSFPLRLVHPTTIVSYSVDCDDIVDLTSASERRSRNITLGDLRCAWLLLAQQGLHVPSWGIAERLRKNGAAEILVRSFATGCGAGNVNLVLWDWSNVLPHKVTAYDPEGRLPRINLLGEDPVVESSTSQLRIGCSGPPEAVATGRQCDVAG